VTGVALIASVYHGLTFLSALQMNNAPEHTNMLAARL